MMAGAVEQDGDSTGVCHQKWGGGDSIPAVGPCREGAMKGTGAPQRWAQAPRPWGDTSPGPALVRAGGTQAFGLCLGWPQPQDGPMPGWSQLWGGPILMVVPRPG